MSTKYPRAATQTVVLKIQLFVDAAGVGMADVAEAVEVAEGK
jgi:hypothetical protein